MNTEHSSYPGQEDTDPEIAPVPVPTAAPTTTAPRSSLSTTGWLLFGGAGAVVVGSFLPWVRATGTFGNTVSASPQGGSAVVFMALAAAVAWVGWPIRLGPVSMVRRVGLAALAALMSVFAFSNAGDLSTLQKQNPTANIGAGPGLLLYCAGVVAIWIAVVRIWLKMRP